MQDYLPMFHEKISHAQAAGLSPLVLAFVGDGVQTLYVRSKFALLSGCKTGELHRLTSMQVKATAQAEKVEKILHLLTEEEQAVYRRARNSKTATSAKNAAIGDYRKASGFEALIGFLYLTGDHDRLNFILEKADESVEGENDGSNT